MNIYPNIESLLGAHDLTRAHEQPFAHTGFSGAELSRLIGDDGTAFVLKRMTIARDWIMRATDDLSCREAQFATARPDLGDRIDTPALAVARDGEGNALLMRDIAADLVPQGMIDVGQLQTIIEGMAALHRCSLVPRGVAWCGLHERLTLLTPVKALTAEQYGAPVAADLRTGWETFEKLAPPTARNLIGELHADPSPLLEALNEIPSALLHGDLKLDNIGLADHAKLWLIDWALTLVAPPAVELGWFLAINSRRLPLGLEDVMQLYADASQMPASMRAKHDGLTILCGLVLRGWRKALDALEADPRELEWWCSKAEEASRHLA